MKDISNNQTYRDIILGLLLLTAILSLICWSECSSAAVSDGLTLCCTIIVPSLFPFFVLSSLVIELGLSRYLGRLLACIMIPLFRISGNCATALALGFVGGYPVGATTAIALYQDGQCSKTEAERLLAFCNNAGPAFIFGVVGTGIFSSGRVGGLLYLGHILASLCVGLLIRIYKPTEHITPRHSTVTFQTTSFPIALTRSITGALRSSLNICAFVLFFTVVIRMLRESGVLSIITRLGAYWGIPSIWTDCFSIGLIELSSGVSTLLSVPIGTAPIAMAAFMLGWGGLSVHCQVLAFISDCDLSMRTYFVGKFLHGILSAGITTILIAIFPLPAPTIAHVSKGILRLSPSYFHQIQIHSTAITWFIWLCFFLLMIKNANKGWKKAKR